MRYRREEEPRERRPDQREADAPPLQAPNELLALQRSAGNRAVSALIARAPADRGTGSDAKGSRATLSAVGTFAIESVNLGVAGRGTGPDEPPREIVVTSRVGAHSTKLAKAHADGTAMDGEIVLVQARTARLVLENAVISSITVSGEFESWTLDAPSATWVVEGEQQEDEAPRRPGWDLGPTPRG